MRLERFETLEALNNYLASAKNVKKVKVLTETGKREMHNGLPVYSLISVFFVLTDDGGEYQK